MKYYSDTITHKGEVHSIDYWIGYLQNFTNEETLTLELQKIRYGGEMFCTMFGEFDTECGKICNEYMPRNRKSGICKF